MSATRRSLATPYSTPRNMHLYLSIVAFMMWAVFIAGLAAMHSSCINHADGLPIPGLQSTVELTCAQAYGYWWFVGSFEFCAVAALAGVCVLGRLNSFKTAFVGVFAVSTLLFVEAAHIFMMAETHAIYSSHTVIVRMQVVCGGAIMTAAVNLFLLVLLGAEALTDSPEPVPLAKLTKDLPLEEMDSPV